MMISIIVYVNEKKYELTQIQCTFEQMKNFRGSIFVHIYLTSKCLLTLISTILQLFFIILSFFFSLRSFSFAFFFLNANVFVFVKWFKPIFLIALQLSGNSSASLLFFALPSWSSLLVWGEISSLLPELSFEASSLSSGKAA